MTPVLLFEAFAAPCSINNLNLQVIIMVVSYTPSTDIADKYVVYKIRDSMSITSIITSETCKTSPDANYEGDGGRGIRSTC